MKKIKILNTEVLSLSEQQLLDCMTERLSDVTPVAGNGVLITPNLDHLVKLQKDKEFYDLYKKA
jgi:UDP-N-acetyl-D-mannosaminuronic acid transferase (WecB/TagA/CpsF family)